MKKILVFLLASVLLFSCGTQSNEDRAKNLIKEYMKTKLDDPASYEAVEFSELIPDSTSYFEDPVYEVLEKQQDSLRKAESDSWFDPDSNGKGLEILQAQIELEEQIHAFEQSYQRQPNGKYFMRHHYRAKNKYGALELQYNIFCFDEDVSMIERKF